MDKLARKRANCNCSIAGDVKLPSMEWTDGQGSILPNLTYGYSLNEVFIDEINCHFTN